MQELSAHQKLDWIHFAIQEALNGNECELEHALGLLEDLIDIELKEQGALSCK